MYPTGNQIHNILVMGQHSNQLRNTNQGSSYLKNSFLLYFFCSDYMFSANLSSKLVNQSSASSKLLFILSSAFFLRYYILHFWLFYGFYVLFHDVVLILFLILITTFLKYLYKLFLNSILGKLFASILLSSFSEDISCSFICSMFLCLHFGFIFVFVAMYQVVLLGTSVLLGRVVLCRRCPVVSSSAVSFFTLAGGSRNVPSRVLGPLLL